MNNEKYGAARLGLLVKYLREFIGEKSWFDFKSNDVAPDKIFARIRNQTLRQLNGDSVFPKTMRQYDVRVFREVLHNCIAHQDYTMQSSIVVSEFPQRLQVANAGAFLPGSVEDVLAHPGCPPYYPNKHLCDVMVELGMIDTVGLGIRTIFGIQK